MAAAVAQYVFKPNPGADLPALIAMIKEAAELWRKYGADVSLWTGQLGEIGNMRFVARFESCTKLGAALDGINGDPAFAAWRVKNIKAGLSTWVRSNQAYEVPI